MLFAEVLVINPRMDFNSRTLDIMIISTNSQNKILFQSLRWSATPTKDMEISSIPPLLMVKILSKLRG